MYRVTLWLIVGQSSMHLTRLDLDTGWRVVTPCDLDLQGQSRPCVDGSEMPSSGRLRSPVLRAVYHGLLR